MRHRTRSQLAAPVPTGLLPSSVATHSLQFRPAFFFCQQVNRRPELALQPDSGAMWCRDVSQGRMAWGGGKGDSTHGSINSQVDVENPLEPAPALGFDLKTVFYSVP